MVQPKFPRIQVIVVDGAGALDGIRLLDVPARAIISARLEVDASSKLVCSIDHVAIMRSDTVGSIPEIDVPPSHLPGRPTPVEGDVEVRRSEGGEPVSVDVGEFVEIVLHCFRMDDDFVAATGLLTVNSDTWETLQIAVKFERVRLVVPLFSDIDVSIMQGAMANVSMPMQWISGAATTLTPHLLHHLSHFPDPDFPAGHLRHTPIEMVGATTFINPGETSDLRMSFIVARFCPVGVKDLRIGVLGSPREFNVNVNVLAAPFVPSANPNEIQLGGGYVVKLHDKQVRIEQHRQAISSVDVSSRDLGEEKAKNVAKDLAEKTAKYIKDNVNDILDGKTKAAQIGAVVYGTATTIVLLAYLPATKVSALVAKVFNVTMPAIGEEVGEFYGSIVDDLVAILKGEEVPKMSEVVGTLGTIFFTQVQPFAPAAGAARFFGATGWAVTREVGKKVSEGLEESIEILESIVDSVGEGVDDVFGDAKEWVEDIFD